MMRVTLGKSRVRESCTPGSVRAKAEWLSYSTVTPQGARALIENSRNDGHSVTMLLGSQMAGSIRSGSYSSSEVGPRLPLRQ
jgi:hypothetical protein